MKYVPHILAAILFIVMGFNGLISCGGSSNNTVNAPSITQAMGDQDVQLDGYQVTVAGQVGDWEKVGQAVMVYILTDTSCVESGDVFVHPTEIQKAPFLLKVTCTIPAGSTATVTKHWKITGYADVQGRITGASAKKGQ